MSRDGRDVDEFLQTHVQNLLSQVDWDELNTAITQRLDACGHRRRLIPPWAVAAGIVLAAGVLIGAVTGLKHFTWRHPAATGWAEVSVSDPSVGKATVSIVGTVPQTRGTCELIPSERRIPAESNPSRPGWCIVVGAEPPADDSRRQDDVKDIMHLL
jgi:hypothetical protein